MSKHTPGPWWPNKNSADGWEVRTRRDKDESDPRANYGCDYGAGICGSIGGHTESRTSGNEEANAHLIAAAPELLEALETIIDSFQGQQYLRNDYVDKAVAAIAKARGAA